ncbi:hypothetical protein ACFO0N_00950 [Halobium salinum]|uniref:Apolipoprotein N-acyltransferase n=1 Tax=Halobium salinum TaxID=1364940 RepID=A0ABD5P6I5_9EURY|nr:hypothetical protein [Halobium salinum]
MGYERLRFALGTLLLASVILPGLALLAPPASLALPAILPVAVVLSLVLSLWLVIRAESYRQVVAFFLASWLALSPVYYLVQGGASLPRGSVFGVVLPALFVLPAYGVAYWFGFHGGAERLYARLAA